MVSSRACEVLPLRPKDLVGMNPPWSNFHPDVTASQGAQWATDLGVVRDYLPKPRTGLVYLVHWTGLVRTNSPLF